MKTSYRFHYRKTILNHTVTSSVEYLVHTKSYRVSTNTETVTYIFYLMPAFGSAFCCMAADMN